ncbi:MAG: carbonic anhydrase [Allosphingosinicella sp.]|uniref:carbonic anhydrase n=1 Tax=Allosphingosinicella sp. TaxID=2823234 RepID=UPI00391FD9E9
MPEFHQLIDGYQRFRAGAWMAQRRRWQALADRQAPPVMVISCCDSRVDPATIFDTVPGQMFALRNVANLVPPFETGGGLHGASAAIEFAVVHLKVRHIVVLGHGACGGISAALKGGNLGVEGPSFIDHWVGIIGEARDRVLAEAHEDPQRALELESIRVSLCNLRSFPFVREREERGELKLHGAFFAISDGELHVLDEATGRFDPAS